MTLRWPAPAKLNLFLHIIGRRADGYHLLQTVFQFVDYCDTLQFHLRADNKIQRLSHIAGLSADQDICVKAARLLQTKSGCETGVDIEIQKVLPMGGGLGGGSSDAATTLVALNYLWKCGFSQDRLESLGLQLGADVPIFVRGMACWAEGVGEQFEAIQPDEPWYIIIAPPVFVSTADIFGSFELTRDSQAITIRDLKTAQLRNDCQAVVEAHYPEVAEAIRWLANFTQARMTGTGACVFGEFSEKVEADAVLAKFNKAKAAPWRAFVARGLNRSPLLDCLETAKVTRN